MGEYKIVYKAKLTDDIYSLKTAYIVVEKGIAQKPDIPSYKRTGTSIVFDEISGAEYRLQDGVWQTSPVFENLITGKEYQFEIRMKETETNFASESIFVKVSTLAQANKPEIPSFTVESYRIVVEKIEGAEYRIGEYGVWQDSNIFEGLDADTEYIMYVRIKATEENLESEAVQFNFRTELPQKKTGCGTVVGVSTNFNLCITGLLLIVGCGFVCRKKKNKI